MGNSDSLTHLKILGFHVIVQAPPVLPPVGRGQVGGALVLGQARRLHRGGQDARAPNPSPHRGEFRGGQVGGLNDYSFFLGLR
jgi:hypothetical protein